MNHIILPSELRLRPPTIEFLVDGLLPAVGIVVAYGATGVGKTAWAMDLMLRSVSRQNYYGRAAKQTPWLYCIAEGVAGLPQRFFAACEHLNIEPEDLDPWIGFRTVPTCLSSAETIAQVEQERKEKGLMPIGVYVLDTHSAHAPSGFIESDTSHNKEVADGWRRVASDQQSAILALHHSGWNGDRIRGSSDLLGTVDASLKLEKKGDVTRTLTVEKARDFALPAPLHLAMRAKFGGVVMSEIAGADLPMTPSMRRLLTILLEASSNSPATPSDWMRLSGHKRSQFHAIVAELLKGEYVERASRGYQLTDTGRSVIESPTGHTSDSDRITNRTPGSIRSDNRISPVRPGSFRTGHRSAESADETDSDRSPTGVRRDSGPGLEPVPWDAFSAVPA